MGEFGWNKTFLLYFLPPTPPRKPYKETKYVKYLKSKLLSLPVFLLWLHITFSLKGSPELPGYHQESLFRFTKYIFKDYTYITSSI